MKQNYLVLMSALTLSALSMEAQTSRKYDPGDAYQKTMRIESPITKIQALKEFGKKYGLDEKNTFLVQTETSDLSGLTHQRHQQFYNGLRVEFGTVITHERNGNVESINGELYNPSGLNLKPSLTAEQGFDIAVNFINAEKYLWEDAVSSKMMDYSKPKGELVIFPVINKGILVLAYKYDIYAATPVSRDEIYVDAVSGDILYKNPIIKHADRLVSNEEIKSNAKKVESILSNPLATGSAATRYSGTKSIETTLDGGLAKYVLLDNTRGGGIVTYNSGKTNTYPSTHFTDTDNTWNDGNYTSGSATKDNAALDAHWGAMMTYDFWKNIFNRNSFDDKGTQIKSYVHYDDTASPPNRGMENAFWNGSVMSYGDGFSTFNGPLTSIDVCGHEIGHAVCTYTANLAYQNQSGALNEGFSDIWGVCIEQYGRNGNLISPVDTASPGSSAVWRIGEDMTTSGYLRSMSYPRTRSQPDTFKGTGYVTTADDGSCTPTGGSTGNDYCGVHTNSGVLNHWFYIVTAGKTGTNTAPVPFAYNVTGIGMTKSSQIAYLAERDYLTPNSTFVDARNATIAVASALYCSTSNEVKAVTDAWYAVNVGAAFSSPANDVALKSISGGNINVNCGAAYSPTIVLENGGTANLTSATITYNVDGGTNSNINWTGNLANCSQATQVISVTGLTRGFHTINVTITTASDGNATNNTKSLVVVVNDNGTVGTVNTFDNSSDVLVSIDSNGKTNSVWERGAVNKTVLTSTATGNSAGYATKLVGDYPDKTTSYLVSQCYNLSNISNATVSFDMAFDLESNWDIIYFEYSTDSGANWNVLGTSADANWYNSSRTPNGTDCFNCIGKQWTGTYAAAPSGGTGVNGNKRNYSHSLTSLGAPANAIFRFTFVSDDAENLEGVFVDNFVVQGTLGNNENSFEQFAVYPNPSNGKFNVVLSTSDVVNIGIYDLRGRSVYNKSFESTGSVFNKEIDLNSLSSGVYILNVNSGGKREAKRIIIE
ncbi:M4 family metallopeptidase [Flavobacterium amniphilum]|uniref:M4 family metallopeptidase n=1 Tax=Flavobacterium amniphilum TaxID=1834035 RepID=UPI00202A1B7B|nr:M4 family metallopeptidase [Flavobacterium amniphilum]MCL9806606.1 M4 family metallopeptidase [Flavobacterium amniphilum]